MQAGSDLMEQELKPRPYRLSEVAWDVVPLVATLVCSAVFFGDQIPFRQSWPGILIGSSMILAVSGAAWMQFSTIGLLRKISRREWRESLALTQLDARSYLVSQLRSRVIVQSIPFFVGGAAMIIAMFCGAVSVRLQATETWMPLRLGHLLFGFGLFIFSPFAMQVCGLAVGVLGLCSRLRRMCKPTGPDSYIVLTSWKWLVVTLAVPGLAIILGFFTSAVLYKAGGEFLVGVYFIGSGSILMFVFVSGARHAWRKAVDEYFKFE